MGAAMLPESLDVDAMSPGSEGTRTDEPSPGHDQDALMLCGVMLAAAGLAGLLTWLLRRARAQWRLVALWTAHLGRAVFSPRPRSRSHSPPASLAYSVIRC